MTLDRVRYLHDLQLAGRQRAATAGEAWWNNPVLFVNDCVRFKDGDKVSHATFGDGIVVERRGDLVTIAFKDPVFGIKMFAANIAPLTILD